MAISVLRQLISRGDRVSLIDCCLEIVPASGKEIPDEWLAKNQARIVQDARFACRGKDAWHNDLASFFASGRKLPQEQTTAEWIDDYDRYQPV